MKTIDVNQGTFAWWALHRGIPTASEFAKIITPAKGELSKSAAGAYLDDLIAQFYDDRYFDKLDCFLSDAVQEGKATEPRTRAIYELDRLAEVELVGFVTTDDGLFGCSPDGLVPSLDRGVENKSPLRKTHIGYLRDGGLPMKYRPQVHASMAITGLRRWDFISYADPFPPLIVEVEWDDYTDKVVAAMDQFRPIYQKARDWAFELSPPPTFDVPADFTEADEPSPACVMY